MPKIDVEEQLKLRFLQPLPACMPRRVVVWHDTDGEFAPEFERLAAEGFAGGYAEALRDVEAMLRHKFGTYWNQTETYEALKALTRTNQAITENSIKEFIEELNVSEDIKKELRAITPHTYTGL